MSATSPVDAYCPTCNTGFAAALVARCPICHPAPALHKRASGRRRKRPTQDPADGPYVNVDATYRNGLTALAVVGLLGTHAKVTTSSSSVNAEVAALEYAMELAAEQHVDKVTFRTDCVSAAHGSKRTSRMAELMRGRPLWQIKCVPRRQNTRAHIVAGKAWREAGLR